MTEDTARWLRTRAPGRPLGRLANGRLVRSQCGGSGFTMTQAEVLYAGPPANYTAAAASSAAAQSLVAGATGNYSQPYVPTGFWPLQGANGKLLLGSLVGAVSGQASPTTMIITIGLATASNSASGTSLLATQAYTITSFSAVSWQLDFQVLCRGAGYGTSSVSTSLLTSALIFINASSLGVTAVSDVVAPNLVTTIDASVIQWLYATVTFSTSSTSNSCTLDTVYLLGMN